MTPDEDTIRFIATRAIEGYRDGLRARVESLDGLRVFHNGVAEKVLWLKRDDVLALIDGVSP
jgi:hypothetical protein